MPDKKKESAERESCWTLSIIPFEIKKVPRSKDTQKPHLEATEFLERLELAL